MDCECRRSETHGVSHLLFMDYAWNAKAWTEDNLAGYYTSWAGEQFGPGYAAAIGDLLRKYALYAARRKPELLDADTYRLDGYGEADRVLEGWTNLLAQAEKINKGLPGEYQDAFLNWCFTRLKRLPTCTSYIMP
nr:glycosyl hydrolase 115 family protein [Paraflavitalea speifideiaquila]